MLNAAGPKNRPRLPTQRGLASFPYLFALAGEGRSTYDLNFSAAASPTANPRRRMRRALNW